MASLPAGFVHAIRLASSERPAVELHDPDAIARWRAEDGVLWLHLDYLEAPAAEWLRDRSGLDAVVFAAMTDDDPRPRVLGAGDAMLVIARAVNLNEGAEPEDMVSLRLWIEPHRVITLRHRVVRAAKTLAADVLDGREQPRTSGALLAELIDRILDPIATCVDTLDSDVDRVQDESLADDAHSRAGRDMRARLAAVRRRAIRLRRFISPQRDMMVRLASMTPTWLDENHRARLREAADRQTRTVEELDAARDRAAVTHDELAGRLAEVSNHRLYILSLVSVVFVPLGFVANLLSVNVGGIPGREVDWGFWALCGGFAVIVAVQLALFRKWRWL
ncbi:MAG TPA: CorA family divalent cation transporter [Kofleriaceae bacterium]|jgi:zinc transporter|nr:CorA family divalent cation transporter [Kofleriaceae bacterium]